MKNQSPLEKQKIDIKDVIEYCTCPYYYYLKKNDNNDYNFRDSYDTALHKCFYSYLMAIQQEDGRAGIDTLKMRWGKEWIKQKRNSQIICTPSSFKRDTYDAKRKSGIDALITFNDIMDQDKQFPIAVNKQYEVQITPNIILTGTWEYIREIERNGKNVIQILKFCTDGNRFRTVHQMTHDIELTAAAYAFKQFFNCQDFELVYVDMYLQKQVLSFRCEKDFNLLKHSVVSTVQSIKHNLQCVAPNYGCYHCDYRNICSEHLK